MQPDSTHGKRNRFPKWLRLILGSLLAVAGIGFLLARLAEDWGRVPFDELSFNPACLALSFTILLAIHFPLYALAWRLLLKGFGEELPFRAALAVFSAAQIGKYIPGKVWFTLGRMSLGRREGIPEAKTLVSTLVEAAFALLSAILLFGIAVLLVPRDTLPGAVYFLFVGIPLCLVAIHPPILNRLLKSVLKKLKRPVFRLEASYGRLLLVLLVYVLDWAAQGLGCYLLIRSFYPMPVAHLPVLLGGYAVSWMLGFLALIAPAGLGIREGIFTFVLRLIVTEPIAIISALVTRVWITLAEALMALVSVLYLGVRRKNAQEAKNPQA